MEWSKMEEHDSVGNKRNLGGITYVYVCETILYGKSKGTSPILYEDRMGFIERWKPTNSKYFSGSVYNAWVCYGEDDCEAGWVDLGWFDFDPSCGDGRMNHCSSLKDLKAFVEQQHELLNKAV